MVSVVGATLGTTLMTGTGLPQILRTGTLCALVTAVALAAVATRAQVVLRPARRPVTYGET